MAKIERLNAGMRQYFDFARHKLALIRYRLRNKSGPRFTRSQYKEVWNSVSKTEECAKLFVAGHTDEDLYRTSAHDTLSMLQTCVGIRPDDVVLEIGAGVGRVGAVVAPLCNKWIGTDVSENMVKYIRQRLAALPNVEAVVINGYDLAPIPSELVDVVYCTVVFMHLEEWERYGYIAEGFRVLKPGGRILVDNVNLASDGGWKFFQEHRAYAPKDRPAQISKTSTPQEMDAYLRRAGFTDIRLRDETNFWIVAHAVKPPATAAP